MNLLQQAFQPIPPPTRDSLLDYTKYYPLAYSLTNTPSTSPVSISSLYHEPFSVFDPLFPIELELEDDESDEHSSPQHPLHPTNLNSSQPTPLTTPLTNQSRSLPQNSSSQNGNDSNALSRAMKALPMVWFNLDLQTSIQVYDIFYLIRHGHLDIIKLQLNQLGRTVGIAYLSQKTNIGTSPLILSILTNRFNIFIFLLQFSLGSSFVPPPFLDCGEDIENNNDRNNTTTHINNTIMDKSPSTSSSLHILNQQDRLGLSPIMHAVQAGNSLIMYVLLIQPEIDYKLVDSSGRSVLHFIIIGQKIDLLRFLVKLHIMVKDCTKNNQISHNNTNEEAHYHTQSNSAQNDDNEEDEEDPNFLVSSLNPHSQHTFINALENILINQQSVRDHTNGMTPLMYAAEKPSFFRNILDKHDTNTIKSPLNSSQLGPLQPMDDNYHPYIGNETILHILLQLQYEYQINHYILYFQTQQNQPNLSHPSHSIPPDPIFILDSYNHDVLCFSARAPSLPYLHAIVTYTESITNALQSFIHSHYTKTNTTLTPPQSTLSTPAKPLPDYIHSLKSMYDYFILRLFSTQKINFLMIIAQIGQYHNLFYIYPYFTQKYYQFISEFYNTLDDYDYNLVSYGMKDNRVIIGQNGYKSKKLTLFQVLNGVDRITNRFVLNNPTPKHSQFTMVSPFDHIHSYNNVGNRFGAKSLSHKSTTQPNSQSTNTVQSSSSSSSPTALRSFYPLEPLQLIDDQHKTTFLHLCSSFRVISTIDITQAQRQIQSNGLNYDDLVINGLVPITDSTDNKKDDDILSYNHLLHQKFRCLFYFILMDIISSPNQSISNSILVDVDIEAIGYVIRLAIHGAWSTIKFIYWLISSPHHLSINDLLGNIISLTNSNHNNSITQRNTMGCLEEIKKVILEGKYDDLEPCINYLHTLFHHAQSTPQILINTLLTFTVDCNYNNVLYYAVKANHHEAVVYLANYIKIPQSKNAMIKTLRQAIRTLDDTFVDYCHDIVSCAYGINGIYDDYTKEKKDKGKKQQKTYCLYDFVTPHIYSPTLPITSHPTSPTPLTNLTSPLIYAVANRLVDIALVLVGAGADVNTTGGGGNNVLMLAIETKSTPLIILLTSTLLNHPVFSITQRIARVHGLLDNVSSGEEDEIGNQNQHNEEEGQNENKEQKNEKNDNTNAIAFTQAQIYSLSWLTGSSLQQPKMFLDKMIKQLARAELGDDEKGDANIQPQTFKQSTENNQNFISLVEQSILRDIALFSQQNASTPIRTHNGPLNRFDYNDIVDLTAINSKGWSCLTFAISLGNIALFIALIDKIQTFITYHSALHYATEVAKRDFKDLLKSDDDLYQKQIKKGQKTYKHKKVSRIPHIIPRSNSRRLTNELIEPNNISPEKDHTDQKRYDGEHQHDNDAKNKSWFKWSDKTTNNENINNITPINTQDDAQNENKEADNYQSDDTLHGAKMASFCPPQYQHQTTTIQTQSKDVISSLPSINQLDDSDDEDVQQSQDGDSVKKSFFSSIFSRKKDKKDGKSDKSEKNDQNDDKLKGDNKSIPTPLSTSSAISVPSSETNPPPSTSSSKLGLFQRLVNKFNTTPVTNQTFVNNFNLPRSPLYPSLFDPFLIQNYAFPSTNSVTKRRKIGMSQDMKLFGLAYHRECIYNALMTNYYSSLQHKNIKKLSLLAQVASNQYKTKMAYKIKGTDTRERLDKVNIKGSNELKMIIKNNIISPKQSRRQFNLALYRLIKPSNQHGIVNITNRNGDYGRYRSNFDKGMGKKQKEQLVSQPFSNIDLLHRLAYLLSTEHLSFCLTVLCEVTISPPHRHGLKLKQKLDNELIAAATSRLQSLQSSTDSKKAPQDHGSEVWAKRGEIIPFVTNFVAKKDTPMILNLREQYIHQQYQDDIIARHSNIVRTAGGSGDITGLIRNEQGFRKFSTHYEIIKILTMAQNSTILSFGNRIIGIASPDPIIESIQHDRIKNSFYQGVKVNGKGKKKNILQKLHSLLKTPSHALPPNPFLISPSTTNTSIQHQLAYSHNHLPPIIAATINSNDNTTLPQYLLSLKASLNTTDSLFWHAHYYNLEHRKRLVIQYRDQLSTVTGGRYDLEHVGGGEDYPMNDSREKNEGYFEFFDSHVEITTFNSIVHDQRPPNQSKSTFNSNMGQLEANVWDEHNMVKYNNNRISKKASLFHNHNLTNKVISSNGSKSSRNRRDNGDFVRDLNKNHPPPLELSQKTLFDKLNPQFTGNNPFHYACMYGFPLVLQLYLDHHSWDLTYSGGTMGQIRTIPLSSSFSPSLSSNLITSYTPFECNNTKQVSGLFCKNDQGLYPIHLAVMFQQFDCVSLLLPFYPPEFLLEPVPSTLLFSNPHQEWTQDYFNSICGAPKASGKGNRIVGNSNNNNNNNNNNIEIFSIFDLLIIGPFFDDLTSLDHSFSFSNTTLNNSRFISSIYNIIHPLKNRNNAMDLFEFHQEQGQIIQRVENIAKKAQNFQKLQFKSILTQRLVESTQNDPDVLVELDKFFQTQFGDSVVEEVSDNNALHSVNTINNNNNNNTTPTSSANSTRSSYPMPLNNRSAAILMLLLEKIPFQHLFPERSAILPKMKGFHPNVLQKHHPTTKKINPTTSPPTSLHSTPHLNNNNVSGSNQPIIIAKPMWYGGAQFRSPSPFPSPRFFITPSMITHSIKYAILSLNDAMLCFLITLITKNGSSYMGNPVIGSHRSRDRSSGKNNTSLTNPPIDFLNTVPVYLSTNGHTILHYMFMLASYSTSSVLTSVPQSTVANSSVKSTSLNHATSSLLHDTTRKEQFDSESNLTPMILQMVQTGQLSHAPHYLRLLMHLITFIRINQVKYEPTPLFFPQDNGVDAANGRNNINSTNATTTPNNTTSFHNTSWVDAEPSTRSVLSLPTTTSSRSSVKQPGGNGGWLECNNNNIELRTIVPVDPNSSTSYLFHIHSPLVLHPHPALLVTDEVFSTNGDNDVDRYDDVYLTGMNNGDENNNSTTKTHQTPPQPYTRGILMNDIAHSHPYQYTRSPMDGNVVTKGRKFKPLSLLSLASKYHLPMVLSMLYGIETDAMEANHYNRLRVALFNMALAKKKKLDAEEEKVKNVVSFPASLSEVQRTSETFITSPLATITSSISSSSLCVPNSLSETQGNVVVKNPQRSQQRQHPLLKYQSLPIPALLKLSDLSHIKGKITTSYENLTYHDYWLRNCIHYCCIANNISALQTFLHTKVFYLMINNVSKNWKRATFYSIDCYGFDPMAYAIMYGNYECVLLLIEAGYEWPDEKYIKMYLSQLLFSLHSTPLYNQTPSQLIHGRSIVSDTQLGVNVGSYSINRVSQGFDVIDNTPTNNNNINISPTNNNLIIPSNSYNTSIDSSTNNNTDSNQQPITSTYTTTPPQSQHSTLSAQPLSQEPSDGAIAAKRFGFDTRFLTKSTGVQTKNIQQGQAQAHKNTQPLQQPQSLHVSQTPSVPSTIVSQLSPTNNTYITTNGSGNQSQQQKQQPPQTTKSSKLSGFKAFGSNLSKALNLGLSDGVEKTVDKMKKSTVVENTNTNINTNNDSLLSKIERKIEKKSIDYSTKTKPHPPAMINMTIQLEYDGPRTPSIISLIIAYVIAITQCTNGTITPSLRESYSNTIAILQSLSEALFIECGPMTLLSKSQLVSGSNNIPTVATLTAVYDAVIDFVFNKVITSQSLQHTNSTTNLPSTHHRLNYNILSQSIQSSAKSTELYNHSIGQNGDRIGYQGDIEDDMSEIWSDLHLHSFWYPTTITSLLKLSSPSARLGCLIKLIQTLARFSAELNGVIEFKEFKPFQSSKNSTIISNITTHFITIINLIEEILFLFTPSLGELLPLLSTIIELAQQGSNLKDTILIETFIMIIDHSLHSYTHRLVPQWTQSHSTDLDLTSKSSRNTNEMTKCGNILQSTFFYSHFFNYLTTSLNPSHHPTQQYQQTNIIISLVALLTTPITLYSMTRRAYQNPVIHQLPLVEHFMKSNELFLTFPKAAFFLNLAPFLTLFMRIYMIVCSYERSIGLYTDIPLVTKGKTTFDIPEIFAKSTSQQNSQKSDPNQSIPMNDLQQGSSLPRELLLLERMFSFQDSIHQMRLFFLHSNSKGNIPVQPTRRSSQLGSDNNSSAGQSNQSIQKHQQQQEKINIDSSSHKSILKKVKIMPTWVNIDGHNLFSMLLTQTHDITVKNIVLPQILSILLYNIFTNVKSYHLSSSHKSLSTTPRTNSKNLPTPQPPSLQPSISTTTQSLQPQKSNLLAIYDLLNLLLVPSDSFMSLSSHSKMAFTGSAYFKGKLLSQKSIKYGQKLSQSYVNRMRNDKNEVKIPPYYKISSILTLSPPEQDLLSFVAQYTNDHTNTFHHVLNLTYFLHSTDLSSIQSTKPLELLFQRRLKQATITSLVKNQGSALSFPFTSSLTHINKTIDRFVLPKFKIDATMSQQSTELSLERPLDQFFPLPTPTPTLLSHHNFDYLPPPLRPLYHTMGNDKEVVVEERSNIHAVTMTLLTIYHFLKSPPTTPYLLLNDEHFPITTQSPINFFSQWFSLPMIKQHGDMISKEPLTPKRTNLFLTSLLHSHSQVALTLFTIHLTNSNHGDQLKYSNFLDTVHSKTLFDIFEALSPHYPTTIAPKLASPSSNNIKNYTNTAYSNVTAYILNNSFSLHNHHSHRHHHFPLLTQKYKNKLNTRGFRGQSVIEDEDNTFGTILDPKIAFHLKDQLYNSSNNHQQLSLLSFFLPFDLIKSIKDTDISTLNSSDEANTKYNRFGNKFGQLINDWFTHLLHRPWSSTTRMLLFTLFQTLYGYNHSSKSHIVKNNGYYNGGDINKIKPHVKEQHKQKEKTSDGAKKPSNDKKKALKKQFFHFPLPSLSILNALKKIASEFKRNDVLRFVNSPPLIPDSTDNSMITAMTPPRFVSNPNGYQYHSLYQINQYISTQDHNDAINLGNSSVMNHHTNPITSSTTLSLDKEYAILDAISKVITREPLAHVIQSDFDIPFSPKGIIDPSKSHQNRQPRGSPSHIKAIMGNIIRNIAIETPNYHVLIKICALMGLVKERMVDSPSASSQIIALSHLLTPQIPSLLSPQPSSKTTNISTSNPTPLTALVILPPPLKVISILFQLFILGGYHDLISLITTNIPFLPHTLFQSASIYANIAPQRLIASGSDTSLVEGPVIEMMKGWLRLIIVEALGAFHQSSKSTSSNPLITIIDSVQHDRELTRSDVMKLHSGSHHSSSLLKRKQKLYSFELLLQSITSLYLQLDQSLNHNHTSSRACYRLTAHQLNPEQALVQSQSLKRFNLDTQLASRSNLYRVYYQAKFFSPPNTKQRSPKSSLLNNQLGQLDSLPQSSFTPLLSNSLTLHLNNISPDQFTPSRFHFSINSPILIKMSAKFQYLQYSSTILALMKKYNISLLYNDGEYLKI